jgi:hypothetical protein
MKSITFEAELKPLFYQYGKTEDRLAETLREIAEDVAKRTGAYVNLRITGPNRSFYEGERYYMNAAGHAMEVSAGNTYTITSYHNPQKVNEEKWKKAVLEICDEYRKLITIDREQPTTIDVLFNDGQGIELVSLQDDKSLAKATEDLNHTISSQELEDLFK